MELEDLIANVEITSMTILLAGDIGGTKTILRLVRSDVTEPSKLPSLTTLHEQTYASREFRI